MILLQYVENVTHLLIQGGIYLSVIELGMHGRDSGAGGVGCRQHHMLVAPRQRQGEWRSAYRCGKDSGRGRRVVARLFRLLILERGRSRRVSDWRAGGSRDRIICKIRQKPFRGI